MADKTGRSGRTYSVDGRKFSWFPLDDDDEPSGFHAEPEEGQ